MPFRLSPRIWAALVLVVFGVISATNAVRIAPGNAPDERAHVEYMSALARGSLPAWDWPANPYGYEAVQPPLYYAAGALILRAAAGWNPLNRLRAVRLLSVFLHLGVLIVLWKSEALLEGGGFAALGPLCVLAAVPMFAFVGSTATNDAAADLAGAALLWLGAGAGRTSDGVRPWVVGLLIGTALLCKFTTASVAAVCVAALWGRKALSPKQTAQAAAIAVAVCGWFYLRNARLYGDPLGVEVLQRYDRDRYAWSEIGTWWMVYFQSFWGRFGQMTRPMPAAAYAAAFGVSIVAASAWIRRGRELLSRPARPLLLAAYGLAVGQNFYYGFFLTHQPQARHSFVALTAWAVLFWDGLSAWDRELGPVGRRILFWILGGAAILLQACAWTSI